MSEKNFQENVKNEYQFSSESAIKNLSAECCDYLVSRLGYGLTMGDRLMINMISEKVILENVEYEKDALKAEDTRDFDLLRRCYQIMPRSYKEEVIMRFLKQRFDIQPSDEIRRYQRQEGDTDDLYNQKFDEYLRAFGEHLNFLKNKQERL